MDATPDAAFRAHFPVLEQEPFWSSLQQHRLELQRCAECGLFRHYPRALCPHCLSEMAVRTQVAGEGALSTWTLVHRAFHPLFLTQTPYTVGLVDLPEGVRVLGRIRVSDTKTLAIGMRMRFSPVYLGGEIWVPGFAAID